MNILIEKYCTVLGPDLDINIPSTVFVTGFPKVTDNSEIYNYETETY